MTLGTALKTAVEGAGILIIYGGGQSQYFTAKCNGDNIFLTAAITFQGETNREDIDLAATGERVDGIVYGEAFPSVVDLDKSSDDCFDDETWVRCYKPIARDMLYATTATDADISKDDWVKYVDGFLTAATDKNDAIGKLHNGGAAITGVSAVEYITSIVWGTD